MLEKLMERIETLCAIPGPSGDETAVAAAIRALAEPIADEVRMTPLGGVLAFKRGKKRAVKTLLYDAHLDEVGFIITGIRDDGTLRFDTLGGVDPRVTLAKRVLVGRAGLPGVVGGKPLNAMEGNDRNEPGPTAGLYIDIGARDRADAELRVALGDTVVFDSDFVRFGDGFVKAKALDDRAGCALLLDVMESDPEYDAWYHFGPLEETGGAGAATGAFAVAPDYAVVVEATTAGDVGGVPREGQVCRCREGAVVSFMDRSTIYPPALYRRAMALAGRLGIPAQTKEGVFGGNDAGSIHKAGVGVPCLAVSLPCRYIHSPSSVVHESDVDAAARLLLALNTELAGDAE